MSTQSQRHESAAACMFLVSFDDSLLTLQTAFHASFSSDQQVKATSSVLKVSRGTSVVSNLQLFSSPANGSGPPSGLWDVPSLPTQVPRIHVRVDPSTHHRRRVSPRSSSSMDGFLLGRQFFQLQFRLRRIQRFKYNRKAHSPDDETWTPSPQVKFRI